MGKPKPDPALVKDQLETLQGLLHVWGPAPFMRYFVWIQSKRNADIAEKTKQKLNTRLVPFVYNPIQDHIEANIGQKNICLKPRQVGLTTWFLMRRIFIPAITTTGTNGYLISQSSEKATEHFGMVTRAYNWVGAVDVQNPEANALTIALHQNLLHTRYSNRKEIIFDQIGNTVRIGSAEVEEAGQGSTLHHIVASEVARWPGNPEETLANLKEALVLEGTIDLESTANGAGGYFYEEYFRAERRESEFTSHFHQWWYQPEYRIPLTEKQAEEMRADLEADEQKLISVYKLDLEQIAFRRNKKLSLRHNFDEKYPEDAITCFLLQGEGFFDREIIRTRMLEIQAEKPLESRGNGALKVFKRPIPGRQYVIGADPASGKQITNESKDYSSADVLDLDTGEQVASYLAKLPPEDFAFDLEQLGYNYNTALLAVERGTGADADGGTVIVTLRNQKYPRLYQHKEHWKKKKTQKAVVVLQDGVPMTGRTRPIALNKAKYMVENFPELIHDIDTVRQMAVFVRNEKGRPEASPGNHDDAVLSFAIGQLARQFALGIYDPLVAPRERYGDTPSEEAAEEEVNV